MPAFFVGPQGSDQNSGTSEATAWKTLANSTRLKPGDILTALPGTITGTFNPPSGTAAAPILFQAKEAGKSIVDGSVRIDGLAWSKITNGWQVAFPRLAFNVFQRSFETDGKLANFNNRDFNQYNSNPQLDLHGTPAEFKWQSGNLRLNAIPSTPQAEPLFAAVVEVALNLNGRSHVHVEGITTRGHKHAVATNGGTDLHFSGCRFTFCGSTAVWLVGLADASMVDCVVQGAGSWGGHYEDLIHTERVGYLRLESLDLSYGGHSGLIMLSGVPGKIVLRKLWFHHMGGSLLTLKRAVDNLVVEDCWFADAAKSTAVDAHKVPHAGIQLSGKGHTFRNCVFIDNGKDVLASSDGNADSNPVCSDNLFDHCTFSGSEAGAVEGQEYAPAGRLEFNHWEDCIIKGDVALFYGGVGDRNSNRLVHCQVVGSTNRGVVLQDCSSNPIPGTGSSLTAPPDSGGGNGGGGDNGGGGAGKPILAALAPTSGPPGTRVAATGSGFGENALVIVAVTVKPETPEGKKRVAGIGTDTRVEFLIPPDGVTGDVQVRHGEELSNPLRFTVTGSGPTNRPPVANTGGPYSGKVGVPVVFDGSGSFDPDGTIAEYRWQFEGFAGVIGGAVTSRTFDAPGSYDVTLTVTDDKGATGKAATTATITAAPPPVNQPPVANAGGPYTGTVGVPVQFDGSKSSDPDGTIGAYTWTFEQAGIAPQTGVKPSVVFTLPGSWVVTLTVTDNQGATNIDATRVTITAAPPPVGELEVGQLFFHDDGIFGGVVTPLPLPAGSTITVTARTPDGRMGTGTATVAGTPPEPPPDDENLTFRRETIRLTNMARASEGVAPLREMVPAGAGNDDSISWTNSTVTGEVPPQERELAFEAAEAGPLAENAALMKCAQDYAELLLASGTFSHTGPDGSTPGERITRAGYLWHTYGENLAQGHPTPQAVVDAWLASPGHRANMLNPSFRDIGVGRAAGITSMTLAA